MGGFDEDYPHQRKTYHRSKWGAYYVMVYRAHKDWLELVRSGLQLNRTEFLRRCLLIGALAMAKQANLPFEFPENVDRKTGWLITQPPNGLRYPRVGGRGQGLRCRKKPEARKSSKIAQTPTRRVHAVLGGLLLCRTRWLKTRTTANKSDEIIARTIDFDNNQTFNT